MKRLNRMCVCFQRKMGQHFDAKVYVWKKAIETNKTMAFLSPAKII